LNGVRIAQDRFAYGLKLPLIKMEILKTTRAFTAPCPRVLSSGHIIVQKIITGTIVIGSLVTISNGPAGTDFGPI
jgi:hypothetical protein